MSAIGRIAPVVDQPEVARATPNHRSKLNRTLTMARRGSMNTVGRPKFGLKKLSVAIASSAVSLSRFSTSSNSSTRPLTESKRPRNPQVEQRL